MVVSSCHCSSGALPLWKASSTSRGDSISHARLGNLDRAACEAAPATQASAKYAYIMAGGPIAGGGVRSAPSLCATVQGPMPVWFAQSTLRLPQSSRIFVTAARHYSTLACGRGQSRVFSDMWDVPAIICKRPRFALPFFCLRYAPRLMAARPDTTWRGAAI
jgi:hypothetical protein